jgi:hypothetical protein
LAPVCALLGSANLRQRLSGNSLYQQFSVKSIVQPK